MEQIINFVKPELIVVSFALYFLGTGLKRSLLIKDKYIPLSLGGIGILISAIYIFGTCSCASGKDIAIAVFTAITQGIIVAGVSTYTHQIIKQKGKED